MKSHIIFYKKYFHCRPTGWLYSLVRKRIVVRKSLTIFEGCHFPRFYISDLIEFSENRDKEFQFGPMLFNLVKLGTISPAAHLSLINLIKR